MTRYRIQADRGWVEFQTSRAGKPIVRASIDDASILEGRHVAKAALALLAAEFPGTTFSLVPVEVSHGP